MLENLHSVLLLQFQILLVQGVDSINHALDQFDLRVAQTVLVGDVISVASLSTRFSPGSSGLNLEFFTPLLQGIQTFLGPSRQVNMDRSPHASAQVSGARVNVAKLLTEEEVLSTLGLDGVSDSLDSSGQSLEDTLDITSLLHGDDPELILLVDPDQESLGIVVEDASALGPVTLHASHFQVRVSRHEQEVVIDQLLADLLIHASQGVVFASQVTIELGEGTASHLFNSQSLLLGDSGRQSESLDAASNTNANRVHRDFRIDIALQFGGIHIRHMLEISRQSVIFADERLKDISKVDVRIFISSVDAAMLVVELNGAGDGLGQGEARGLGDDATQLVPFLLGHVLGNQAVLRLDIRKFSSHCFK